MVYQVVSLSKQDLCLWTLNHITAKSVQTITGVPHFLTIRPSTYFVMFPRPSTCFCDHGLLFLLSDCAIFLFSLCIEVVCGASLRNCAQCVSYICAYNTVFILIFVLIIFIMAPKCSDKAKRTHKVLNLQEKLELIKLGEKGMSMTDIGHKLG
jgi:hypothetical protein